MADLTRLILFCRRDDESEEQWAVRNGISLRTIRRAKARQVKLQKATLRRLALAMRQLGGTVEQREKRIRAAVDPID